MSVYTGLCFSVSVVVLCVVCLPLLLFFDFFHFDTRWLLVGVSSCPGVLSLYFTHTAVLRPQRVSHGWIPAPTVEVVYNLVPGG